MDKSVSERQKIWDDFLRIWPLEKLATMSLQEFTAVNTGESFCNWLEKKTEDIGSIWGGSAFKFGVYERLDKEPKESKSGRMFSEDYGWLEKYGNTHEEAYTKVREHIVDIATNAKAGNLEAIDDIDFGSATKWKIAFLYQDQTHPTILPIFKSELLKLILDNPPASVSECHKAILQTHAHRDILELGSELFTRIETQLELLATPEKAKEYLDNSESYSLIKDATKYIAGYATEEGYHLALTMTGNKAVIYIEPCLSENFIKSESLIIEEYEPGRSRNSNISANAPRLSQGNAMLKITVPTMAQLTKICNEYTQQSQGVFSQMENNNSPKEKQQSPSAAAPLNQIIYGPPGTGKTYSTTAEAVKLAEPAWYEETKTNVFDEQAFRKLVKARYDELINQGRIAFTTFHQSFSYEDFVEGIRALTDEDKETISYEVVDGIFKQLCTSASVDIQNETKQEIELSGRKIWKMSLGDTRSNEDHIYDECTENNYVLLGWGQDINFTDCSNRQEVKEKIEDHLDTELKKNDYAITSVNQFKNEIKIGDIIIVSDGNHKFRAIAEVTGDYEFLADDNRDEYQQLRKVKWLRHYSPSLPRERLFKKALSQMTLYQLRPSTVDLSKLSALLNQSESSAGGHLPHVLIIDEINRGNLSRIFGELITLIEPDKRQGGEDQRTVILPYSKEPFSVPNNLYILGTMNTADKSLAQLDLALRRRFEFIELLPQPELLSDVTVFGVKVSDILNIINQRIEVLLDRDHAIGHSHFWPLKTADSQLEKEKLIGTIFKKRIIPLLQEYFFADWERISWVLNDVDKALSAQFIHLENTGLPLNTLFSSSVVEEINDRRYRINEEAFTNPDAYIGILPSQALSDD